MDKSAKINIFVFIKIFKSMKALINSINLF